MEILVQLDICTCVPLYKISAKVERLTWELLDESLANDAGEQGWAMLTNKLLCVRLPKGKR